MTYDIPQAAEYLKLHPQTVLERVRAGKIKAFKPGRRWVFLLSDLEAYLKGCQSTKEGRLGGSNSRSGVGELENLLGLPKGKRRRSTTTGKRQHCGV